MSTSIKSTLNALISGAVLDKSECKKVMTQIGQGEVNEYQTASLLTAFQMREITGEELSGFREAMIELALHVDLSDFDTVDIVGTGGDGKNTFNISTLSSLVVAGAGYKVAKHGNVGKSSVSGSSNVLQHFGYNFSNDHDKLRKDLETNNFCYMHAPLFHPAMKYVGAVRRGLGIGTFFNMLGPLLNPSRCKKQVSGVWAPFIIPLYRTVLNDMGSNYAVIYANDGYDEISLTSSFQIATKDGVKELSPSDLGLPNISPSEIYGGKTPEEAAALFLRILEGNGTDAQNAVIHANAGYGIQRFNPSASIEDCIQEAKESLQNGNALSVLKGFQ